MGLSWIIKAGLAQGIIRVGIIRSWPFIGSVRNTGVFVGLDTEVVWVGQRMVDTARRRIR